jgi:hypothetical protein
MGPGAGGVGGGGEGDRGAAQQEVHQDVGSPTLAIFVHYLQSLLRVHYLSIPLPRKFVRKVLTLNWRNCGQMELWAGYDYEVSCQWCQWTTTGS